MAERGFGTPTPSSRGGAAAGGARVGGPRTPAAAPLPVSTKIRIPRVRWLPRQRLDRLLEQAWQHRLTFVVAPAGSGKTTLLACWASAAAAQGIAVAWYRAEHTDTQAAALLDCLGQAVATALGQTGGADGEAGRQTADDLARVVERAASRLLIIVDDEHVLAGSPAEAALERLAGVLPPDAALVIAGRTAPAFDVSRRRVSGELLEIGGDDLRFRSWEVEGLFRDFYGDALSADELARLARRTEGWAAGLQLFHLATQGKPPPFRRTVLESLASGSRLMREYLTRNVVDELPPERRDFLVRTSVLRRLTGPLCDRLLDACGSAAVLEALERGGVFTVALDDAGTYRYHEVLRSHLEGVLVDELGEGVARELSLRAGELLEADGATAEAVAAYCRAGAWDRVARAVGPDASKLDAGPPFWLDLVPAPLVEQDPWLMLSIARALRGQGRWRDALGALEKAERAFGAADGGIAARRERLALAAFLGAPRGPVAGWPGIVHAALVGDPGAAGRNLSADLYDGAAARAGATFARGFADLLGGYVRRARAVLRPLADDPDTPAELAAVSRLVAALALWLGVVDDAATAGTNADDVVLEELERALAEAERLGLDWVSRVGAASRALVDGHSGPADGVASLRIDADLRGDRWTALIASLLEGAIAFRTSPELARPSFETAAALAQSVSAHTVEAWATAAAALAAAQVAGVAARDRAVAAERLCRAEAVAGARTIALRALELAEPANAADHRALRAAIAAETGMSAGRPGPDPSPADATNGSTAPPGAGIERDGQLPDRPAVPAAVDIRLFGQFAIAVEGVRLDLRGLKPRSRAVLHRLALDAGRPVHREILQAAFWPEADAETAARNLHVALSALRHELADGDGRSLIERDGEAYRLVVPAGGRVDLVAFWETVAQGRQARARGRTDDALRHFAVALDVADGELLPEDGPADWLVDRRGAVEQAVVESARTVAEMAVDTDHEAAVRACTTGLRADPHADALWRLLIAAHERAGETASAAAARRGYSALLASLDVGGAPDRDGAARG